MKLPQYIAQREHGEILLEEESPYSFAQLDIMSWPTVRGQADLQVEGEGLSPVSWIA